MATPPLSEVTVTIGCLIFYMLIHAYDCNYAYYIVVTAKCNLITLLYVIILVVCTCSQEERMCQNITLNSKKAKLVGVVGDDSLTGLVEAGRLEDRHR